MNDSKPKPPADMWEILDRERQRGPAAVDCFSQKEYGERYGLPSNTAYCQIQLLLKRGVIERLGKYGPGHQVYYAIKKDKPE